MLDACHRPGTDAYAADLSWRLFVVLPNCFVEENIDDVLEASVADLLPATVHENQLVCTFT